MKLTIYFFIGLLIVGCSSIPTKESGMAKVQIRAFFYGQNQLKVRVSEIINTTTNATAFTFSEKQFGSNEVIIPAGEYNITFSCFQEVGVWGTSLGEGQHPEYTEKVTIKPGENLRLTYEHVSNIKHGNHCKPFFLTNL